MKKMFFATLFLASAAVLAGSDPLGINQRTDQNPLADYPQSGPEVHGKASATQFDINGVNYAYLGSADPYNEAQAKAYLKCRQTHPVCREVSFEDGTTVDTKTETRYVPFRMDGFSARVPVQLNGSVTHYRVKAGFIGFDQAVWNGLSHCHSKIQVRFAEASGVAAVNGEPLHDTLGDLGFERIDRNGARVNIDKVDTDTCAVHVSRQLDPENPLF